MDYDRLRELQQKFDENPRRYFAPLANEYRKGGQPKRAIEICRAQLEQMPGHMSGQIVYGQALYEAGEFAEARQVFERALTLDPENLIALRSLGDMSLQAGNAREARDWYSRLLDADPKDTSVVALISEIDSAADAKPVPANVPGIDTDVGDQQIPAGLELTTDTVTPDASMLANTESQQTETPASTKAEERDDYPPLGLERHYPVEEPSRPASQTSAAEQGPSFEDLGVPTGESATEGLKSAVPEVNALESVQSRVEPNASESVFGEEQEIAPPAARAEQTQAAAPPQPVEAQRQVEPAEQPQRAEAAAPTQPAEPAKPVEEKTFTGASAEPFVNETMAKLYLKQGYKQLALKVYRQLVYARPNDQALKDRIAEIEAADAAEHPGEAPVRREPPREESPVETQVPRAPSVEAPTPATSPDSEEDAFGFETTPPDSAVPEPSRQRESVEAPTREAPRAEPEGMSGRQPSIREFFATLGRRRPPPQPRGGGFRSGNAFGNNSSTSPGGIADSSQRAATQQPADTQVAFGTSAPAPSLDSVFAGATVSPSDARAASRLAGAFSGAAGASRTPPTPPMPTPRVNPRVQAQESEEDVAKFRAWLDGLTGE